MVTSQVPAARVQPERRLPSTETETVPVGTPVVEATATRKRTVWPNDEADGIAVSVVVVPFATIVWVRVDDADAAKIGRAHV